MELRLERENGKSAAFFLALAFLICGVNAENVSELKLAVVFLDNVSTCVVGDYGNASSQCCGLVNTTSRETLFAYRDNYNFRGLDSLDLKLGDYRNKICMSTSLTSEESVSIREKIDRLADDIKIDSAGTLVIKPYYIEYSNEDANRGMAFTRAGNGLYPSPADIADSLKKSLSNDTDYVLVVYSLDDATLGISMSSPGCASINGELKGAVYGILPITQSGAECSPFSAFAEELYYSVKEVTKLPAAFPSEYPKNLCGTYTRSTYDWFPDPAKRSTDPDFEACQAYYGDWAGYCVSILPRDCEEEYLRHLIKNHYPPGTKIFGNHCANNVRDFGETGIDCGGTCPECIDAITTTSSTTTSSTTTATITITSSTTTSSINITSTTTTTSTSTTTTSTITSSSTTSTMSDTENNGRNQTPSVSEIGILVSIVLFGAGYVLTNRQKKKAKVASDVTIISDKLIAQLDKKIDYYSKRDRNAQPDPDVFEDFIVESIFAEDYQKILKADKSIRKDLRDLSVLVATVKKIRTAAYDHFPDRGEADDAIEYVLNGSNPAADGTTDGIEEFYIRNVAELAVAESDESIYEMIVGKCMTLKDKILEVRNEYRGKAYQPKKPGTESIG
jgi:hypothetical protein